MKRSILIIDDEKSICSSLSFALEDHYIVKAFMDPEESLQLAKKEHFDLCLLDLKIGSYNGIDILLKLKEIDLSMVIIIMTAYGSIDSSVEAMQKGAYTYLTKPLNIKELLITIKHGLEYRDLHKKVEYLSLELKKEHIYNGLIGKSPSMSAVFGMIEKLKDIDTNVVIMGESGTGKELVARALHFSGKRRTEHFHAINCAAIPEGLLEEELFGHKKGSFTDAIEDRKGAFEYANNGTIFFDEIGDMPLVLQVKLLRVLQEKEFTPIGSREKKKINVRIISATNHNLKELVANGKFRQDLYFRLNVIEIALPPLREKKQDLPLLFKHFIALYSEILNKNITGLSREAERLLLQYDYPGNIRELSNIIEYAIVVSSGSSIQADNLPQDVLLYDPSPEKKELLFENMVGLTLKDIEKKVISKCLATYRSQKKTASVLGISEKGLRNKLHEYGLLHWKDSSQ